MEARLVKALKLFMCFSLHLYLVYLITYRDNTHTHFYPHVPSQDGNLYLPSIPLVPEQLSATA